MYGDPPSRRSRDPPSSSSSLSSAQSNRRKPREQVHNTNTSARRNPPKSHYLLDDFDNHRNNPQSYSSSQYYKHRHDPNSAYRSGVDSDRPTLRKRGSSSDRIDEPSHYRHDRYSNGHTREHFAMPRIRHSSKKNTATSRLSRIFALVIMCMFMIWGSFWGIEIVFGLARRAYNVIFGRRDPDSSSGNQLEKPQSVLGSEDSLSPIQGLRGFTVEFSDAQNMSSQPDSEIPESLSIHDLNAKSHLLKAEGRQIINDRPMENDEFGKGDKAYMGQDSTNDFFFAGGVTEKKRIVNTRGSIETISYPAHSYALLPALLDSNPFAISIWIFLSPLKKKKEKDVMLEDNHLPRVIVSTRSRNHRGCNSDVFGESSASGFVLYAQPYHHDIEEGDGDANAYQIVLEYALAGDKLCRALIGSNKKDLLVREGQWHHVTVFATQISNEGDERISLYINGDLAGRKAQEPRRFHSSKPESKTTVGRYSMHDGSSSSKSFDLGGRVGMLSFWETGGDPLYSTISKRMKILSESDEDHVVRAINRAAFDTRAIQELSLQGLTVKEPTLLYTFDGRNEKETTNELYSESLRLVSEVMSGRNGTIMTDLIDGMPAHQRQAFIAQGPNRYPEYKDGTFVPPKLKESKRQELNEIARARSGVVKKAMQHAWSGYKKYAFGRDELLPLSNGGQDNWGGMGTTLVDSLSTLWIVGMKEEFWEARDWVRDYLDFGKVDKGVSVFETTIRNLGGLLSAYDLSGDKVFLEKADDLGMRLRRAFESRTGIPYGEIELFDGGRAYNTGWHPNEAVLSEIGTLQVEFRYLAKVTGKSEYATDVMRALDELLKLDAESGLYPTFIHNTKQELSFGNNEISIGAMGDSFYEYLLKVWLQGGKKEMKYRRMYDKSINGILDKLVHMSRPNYLTYVAERKGDRVIHKMDHLSCFLGGNLALGAYTHPDGLDSRIAQRQLKTGKQLAYTCYQMYARSKSGLSPEYVKFDTARDDFVKGHAPYFILRPETSETFYILYHLTKDPIYREWGWEIFQAIEEYCKTDAGYAAIRDVDTMKQDNRMESFFLAETLKYLYLLQDDTNEIDLLTRHVFNTEAHPLRLLSLAPNP